MLCNSRMLPCFPAVISGLYVHLCLLSVHRVSACPCRAKMDGPYDSRVLPVLLASILMVALVIVFSGAIAQAAGWA